MRINCHRPVEERFMQQVLVDDGCWEWGATRSRAGYGVIQESGRLRKFAHRLSYEIFVGDPTGMSVCHHCDNPGCVKPSHLFLGTQADNMRDMRGKGRAARGERNGMAKLTRAEVKRIRELANDGALSQRQIGNRFGVHQQTVSRIKLGLRWGGDN